MASSTTHGNMQLSLRTRTSVSYERAAAILDGMSDQVDEWARVPGRKELLKRITTFMSRVPFPPCATPLAQLEDIKIIELTKNAHHHGRVLWLARREHKPLFDATHLSILVQDADARTEILEVNFADQQLGIEGLYPRGTVIAVKEPC